MGVGEAEGLIKVPQSSVLQNSLGKKPIGSSQAAGSIPTGPSRGLGGPLAPMPISSGVKPPAPTEVRFSDYLRMEKMRKYKRLPRLVGQRNAVRFTCPNCNKEGSTVTNYEFTGT